MTSTEAAPTRTFPRCALVTNLCPDYRLPIFRLLVDRLGVDLYLFGGRRENYWDPDAVRGDLPLALPMPAPGPAARARYLMSLARTIRRTPYDVVIKCVNGSLELPVTWAAARSARRKFILWTGIWHHPRTITRLAAYPALRTIYRNADALCVYGTHVERYLVSKGIPRDRIFVVGQPVPPLPGAEERNGDPPAPPPYFLYVGRFAPEKGVEYLIDAFGRLNGDARLVLVGNGPLERGLRHRAMRQPNHGSILFAGPARGAALTHYYRHATALVLPSVTTRRCKETWGLVANEAMSIATPVVATTAVGAVAGGMIRDGATGLVVPERDAPTLARALDRVLTSRDLRDRIARSGREAAAGITYEGMLARFRDAILHAASA